MASRLSLRVRVFLFFCLMALTATVLVGGALVFGWSRAEDGLPVSPFLTAFLLFLFLNTGFMLGIWLLFDENIAKPINKLSADLRLRAHSGVQKPLDTASARYLGDLGPAADALSQTMSSSVMDAAEMVAHETQRLRSEKERLTSLLSEMPIASILLNPKKDIVLYDAQAADVLALIAPPRLRAPIADYLDVAALEAAMSELTEDAPERALEVQDSEGRRTYTGRIKDLGGDGHMLFLDVDAATTPRSATRKLVFDFDLMNETVPTEMRDASLSSLCFVPFDTETTGLSVEEDAIVQIGAVRVLNGRVVEGEEINTFVNPGRPIPPAATRIHHVTDQDVKDAPDIAVAGRRLHHFCRDAVLVAHNAPFDIGLLRQFQPEMEVEWSHPVVDTVLLSAIVFGTTEEHTLDALCERLSIVIEDEDRHTAIGDARATADVLVKLLPLLAGKGIETFGQLLNETKAHARLLNDLNE